MTEARTDTTTRVVRREECRADTTQTTGMVREEAVRTDAIWAGLATTAGRAKSGWHHHGDYESIIHVLRGRLRLEYGPGGHTSLQAGPGDTVYVAPGEIHREGNPDEDASEIFLVRSGHGEIVVNVEGPPRDR